MKIHLKLHPKSYIMAEKCDMPYHEVAFVLSNNEELSQMKNVQYRIIMNQANLLIPGGYTLSSNG
jgi:hypothetical protein